MRSKKVWLDQTSRGFLMGFLTLAALLWLAITNALPLYVHPRYEVFTIVMSSIGLGFMLLAAGFRKRLTRTERTAPLAILTSSICIIICLAILLLPPKPLTSNTAQQRGIASQSLDTQTVISDVPSDQAYAQFGIKQWVSLLAQTTDPAFFNGKQVNVTGFISPGETNDIFYVSRFVLTCCAVDARPIGLPVYKQNWRQTYQADQWVNVTGGLISSQSKPTILVQPKTITPTSQPENPYVY